MRLLVIGDLNSHVSLAIRIARDKGADVASVGSISRALDYLRMHGAELILIDVKLSCRDLVTALSQERISTPVMAYGTTHDPVLAAQSIRGGAKEYLPFPPDPELIGSIIASITEHHAPIVAHDPATLGLISMAKKIAISDASVLITGERGKGKVERERKFFRALYMTPHADRQNHLCPSIVLPFRKACSKANSSVMKKAPLPALSRDASENSMKRKVVRCFSTKSPR